MNEQLKDYLYIRSAHLELPWSGWGVGEASDTLYFLATPAREHADEMLEALNYLLEQTIDHDLKYGITLTEGEEDARQRALAVIAKVAA